MILFVKGIGFEADFGIAWIPLEYQVVDQATCNTAFVFGVHLVSLSGITESMRPKQLPSVGVWQLRSASTYGDYICSGLD